MAEIANSAATANNTSNLLLRLHQHNQAITHPRKQHRIQQGSTKDHTDPTRIGLPDLINRIATSAGQSHYLCCNLEPNGV